MVKKFFRVIAAVACMACMVTMTSGCGTMFLPKCDGVEISGTPVDNDYNNGLTGANLVRIGNKLYFNYAESELACGVVELSSEGAEPIVSSKFIEWNMYPLTHRLRVYHDQLLMEDCTYTISTEMMIYTSQTNQTESFEEINGICVESFTFQQCGDVLVQEIGYPDTLAVEDELRWYYQGEQGELSPNERKGQYYVTEDSVYYTVIKTVDGKEYDELHHFQCKNQTDDVIWVPDQLSFIAIWEGDDSLFFVSGDENQNRWVLYEMDLHTESKVVKQVQLFEYGPYMLNVYDRMLYLKDGDTLVTYDLTTGEYKTLLEENAKDIYECYVFDDTWVYYVLNDGGYPEELYRVKQDGTCFEKVYG